MAYIPGWVWVMVILWTIAAVACLACAFIILVGPPISETVWYWIVGVPVSLASLATINNIAIAAAHWPSEYD